MWKMNGGVIIWKVPYQLSLVTVFCGSVVLDQYGLLASFGLLSCTLRRFIPIWNPFIAWMAAWADAGLSKLTNPERYKYDILNKLG